MSAEPDEHQERLALLRQELDEHHKSITLLRQELEAARKAAESDQLVGVGVALRAAIAHLRREGIEPSLLHLLDMRLLGALSDIGVGKSHPLLERRRREKNGRPPINSEKAALMATGSAYIDCAMEAGASERKAAEDAAGLIAPQLGRGVDAEAMMRFRDKLRAGDGSDMAKTIYNGLQEKSKKWPPDEAAGKLLDLLSRNIS